MTVKKHGLLSTLIFATASFNVSAVTDSGTLSTEKANYGTDELITINYENSGADDDWIGIYKAGKIKNSCKKSKKYITYQYAENSGGSVNFGDLPEGNYEAQLFAENGYCHIGKKISFTVSSGGNNGGGNNGGGNNGGGNTGSAAITTSKTSYSEGETIAIGYSNSSSSKDWVGFYKAGTLGSSCDSNSNGDYLTWKYTASTSGTVNFSGLDAGAYDVQLFADDGYCFLGSPLSVTVTSAGDNNGGGNNGGGNNGGGNNGGGNNDTASISASKSTYSENENITISYNNSSSSQDWVGFYRKGTLGSSCDSNSNGDYVTWKYTENSSGSVSFSGLDVGQYDVQLFKDDGYCHLGSPISLTVTGSGGNNGGGNNGGGNNGGGNNGGDVAVTVNPYKNVNWSSYGQYKANFHTHTTRSDGDMNPARVIDEYHQAGYKILSITDHDTITWPWSNYGRNPSNLGMLAVKGDEYSRSHHVNVFYNFSTARSSLESGIPHVQNSGGLCQINHPKRYSNASDWEWYLEWYQQYPACVGIEVVNRNTRFPELWDNINENFFKQNRKLVWGWANDDMHDTSELYRSFQFMLMPNLSESALKQSKRDGASYFCNEPGGSGNAIVPRITSIDVDNSSKTISVYAEDYDSITWFGPGSRVVGTGNTVNFESFPDKSFVRAELDGRRGTCYTQPFGIEAN